MFISSFMYQRSWLASPSTALRLAPSVRRVVAHIIEQYVYKGGLVVCGSATSARSGVFNER